MQPLAILLLLLGGIVAFILFIIFVMVPVFRGIGWLITNFFGAIGWLVSHIFEFIGGIISDIVRLIGSVLALAVLSVLVPLNVVIGRWSAASHFAEAVKREAIVAGGCVYRSCLRRPLKLLWLHGVLEGLEERVPEAMYAAPTADKPSHRTGQFDGYTIVGSLRAGGSGGKLYVARPDEAKRAKLTGRPDLVVIKTFTLTEGSSLPQIVRESRALECAKQLGHVLEHGMDEHRFFYVMPYHAGDHLGIIARQLHAQSDGRGLSHRHLGDVMGYIKDLLATLTVYHDGGFWHKDIKPENIIVHDGRAHVVDLGLITPLKSAMTLTTHGTEYFRDPEMVRQALRGVKVHQVNGVKFDIYAAGAVLYFVLENTFPAHGGLSRFTRKSPEALRWIVKRAMAEYNQRYESAEMMLADLEVVANAADPFEVKPAQLPSMRAGGSDHDAVVDPAEIAIETQTESPQAAQVAAVAMAGSPAPKSTHAAKEGPQRRPTLRVVDWFTGKYVVHDAGSAAPGLSAAGFAGARRGDARHAWKQERDRFAREARRHADGARRTAREQIAAARDRVRHVQSRVAKRRHAVGFDQQPSSAAAMTTILVFAVIFAVVWFAPFNVQDIPAIGDLMVGSNTVAETPPAHRGGIGSVRTVVSGGGPPVLAVIDAEEDVRAAVRGSSKYRDLAGRYRADGYHVLAEVGPDTEAVRELLRQWREQPGGEISESLEAFLAEHDLYGFLQIRATTSSSGAVRRVDGTLISSTDPKARERRWPHLPASSIGAPPDLPYLLINEHPAKSDPRVADRIAHLVSEYEAAGWTVLTDDDAEVEVRKVIPAGGLNAGIEPPARLAAALAQRELGGVLLVIAPPGEAPPHERLDIIEIRATATETVGDLPRRERG